MKHLFNNRLFFFAVALYFPVYSAIGSLGGWETPFEMEWELPLTLFLLLVAGWGVAAFTRRQKLLPAPVLWGLLGLSAAYGLAGNLFLYAAPWQAGISLALTMGVLCLLWALLRRAALLLWVPFLLMEMAQMVGYYQYGSRINSLVLAETFEASAEEAGAYLTPGNIGFIVLICLLSVLFAWLQYRLLRRQKFIGLVNTGLLCSLVSVLLCSALSPNHSTTRYYWPIDEACELYGACVEALTLNQATITQVESLASPAQEPSSLPTLSGGEGVVLVVHIGESVRADRMSINGYARDTTPWLASQKGRGLINFPDCISAACDTCQAQIAILTDARRDVHTKAPEMVPHTGSVLDLFHANGFGVYSFFGRRCAQQLKYDRVVRVLTRCSERRFNAPGSPWTAVPQMAEVLRENNTGRNLLFFINNEGSHTPFSHYDTENTPFFPAGDDFQNPSAHAQEVNNAYDSTVHYTDEFVRRVVHRLRGRPYLYLYVSDHGEYLGHDGIWGRAGLGESTLHYHDTTGSRVGMFVLASPEFRALNPHFAEALDALQAHAGLTVGHEHIFHTLIGLFGIQTPHYNPALDLTSESVQPYFGPKPKEGLEPGK